MEVVKRIWTKYSNNVSPVKCLLCFSAPTAKHAFAIPCLHEFCYNCLFDCMEVRPHCPICTKPVTEIIYDVRGVDDYKTLSVKGIATRTNVHFVLQQMLSTLSEIYHLFLHHSEEISSFARLHRGEEFPQRTDSLTWRLYIYENGIYSMPIPDENGRLRECSAAYYTLNTNSVARIWPWLSRELRALEKYTSTHICSQFCKHIFDKLRVSDLYSLEFYNLFSDHNFPFTNHFIYELYNFAISTCSMLEYDSLVMCNPFFDRHFVVNTYTDLNGRHIENTRHYMDNRHAARSNWDERVDYGRAVLYRLIRQNNNDIVSVDIDSRGNNVTNINVNVNVDNNRNVNADDSHSNSEEEDVTDDDTPSIAHPTDPSCYCFAHRLDHFEGIRNRPVTPPTYIFDNIKNLNSKELAKMVKCSPSVHSHSPYSVLLKDLLPSKTTSSASIVFDSSSSGSDTEGKSRMQTRSGNRRRKLLSNRITNERKNKTITETI